MVTGPVLHQKEKRSKMKRGGGGGAIRFGKLVIKYKIKSE